MSKLIMLAMKDTKVGIYLQPFAAVRVSSAVRDIGDLVKDPQGSLPWQRHPEDFDLYQVGTFDDDTGEIEKETPSFIVHLTTLKG